MSIDGVSLDANDTSVEDASKMLRSNSDHVRIEILPMSQLAIEAPKNMNCEYLESPCNVLFAHGQNVELIESEKPFVLDVFVTCYKQGWAQ